MSDVSFVKDASNIFEKLEVFFAKIIKKASQYDYCVFLTRRSFNLSDMFFQKVIKSGVSSQLFDNELSIDEINDIRSKKFISQNALFAKADELVEFYFNTGFFPKILIVDELLIHGRGINSLMQTLEALVFEAWKEKLNKENISNLDKSSRLVTSLILSIDFYIFARNKDYILLKNTYRYGMKYFCEMTSKEWRHFVVEVSYWLSKKGAMTNMNYVPSFWINGSAENAVKCLVDDEWSTHTGEWRYFWLKEKIYQKGLISNAKTKAIFTIRIKEYDNNAICVSPLAFIGDINGYNLDLLCEKLALALGDLYLFSSSYKKDEILRIKEILCMPYYHMRKVKSQLVICIVSTISFLDAFCNNEIVFENDFEKVSKNFDTTEKIFGFFKLLSDYKELELRNKLRNCIYSFLEERATPFRNDSNFGVSFENYENKDYYIKQAEDYFYGISMEDEKYAFRLKILRTVYDSFTRLKNKKPLNDYLEKISGNIKSKISALLVLIDMGVISMDTAYEDQDSFNEIKVGEFLKIAHIGRYYKYLPALSLLEWYCLSYGYSVEKIARRFGLYLNEIDNVEEDLGNRFFSISNDIRLCGYQIKDWNVYQDDLIGYGSDREKWGHILLDGEGYGTKEPIEYEEVFYNFKKEVM